MSGCHGNKIVPLLGGSSQAKEHQKGSASAPESHGVVMGSDLHKRGRCEQPCLVCIHCKQIEE